MPPAYIQIVIQTVGFVIWVASLGGPFATLNGFQEYHGSVVPIPYTVLVPLWI